jgi:hypothetical protein
MMSGAVLPPLFQILTGLSFLAILVLRFAAPRALKPVWGRVVGFSLIFVALGNFLLSQATAKSLSAGAELFALAGASFAVSAVLVTAGLFIAARGADGVERS